MNILIDTQIMLWSLQNSSKLKTNLREKMQNANAIFVSIASLWECAIKINLGKLEIDFLELTNALQSSGFEVLSLKFEHLLYLSRLKWAHPDPFDRLLVCQAKSEPLILISADKEIQTSLKQ